MIFFASNFSESTKVFYGGESYRCVKKLDEYKPQFSQAIKYKIAKFMESEYCVSITVK